MKTKGQYLVQQHSCNISEAFDRKPQKEQVYDNVKPLQFDSSRDGFM